MQHFIKKYYIYVFFIAIIAGVFFYAAYQSFHMYRLIQSESVTLKQAQMDNSLAEEYIQDVYIFQRNADYIMEHDDHFDVLMVNDDDHKVRLFSALEAIAADTGNHSIALSVKKFALDKGKDPKDPTVVVPQNPDHININMALVGNYNDLIAFIKKLENMSYMTDILSIKSVKTSDVAVQSDDILDDESSVRTQLLKSDIDVVFYLQPQEKK